MADQQGNTPRPPASAHKITPMWPLSPALLKRMRALPADDLRFLDGLLNGFIDSRSAHQEEAEQSGPRAAEVLKFPRKKRRARRA